MVFPVGDVGGTERNNDSAVRRAIVSTVVHERLNAGMPSLAGPSTSPAAKPGTPQARGASCGSGNADSIETGFPGILSRPGVDSYSGGGDDEDRDCVPLHVVASL